MEIFNFNLCFANWGEIYIGIKRDFITQLDVLRYCKQNRILTCSKERALKIEDAIKDSLFTFISQLNEFFKEDGLNIVPYNEDSNYQEIENYNEIYLRIWQLEYLLRIRKNYIDLEERQDKISENFIVFNYPDDWQPFIEYNRYLPHKSLSDLDKQFNIYIDKKIVEMSLTHSII